MGTSASDLPVSMNVTTQIILVNSLRLMAEPEIYATVSNNSRREDALNVIVAVMVAFDDDLIPVELVKIITWPQYTSERHIPQVEHNVLRLHTLIPPADKLRVHVANGFEWSVAVLDDVLMAENGYQP